MDKPIDYKLKYTFCRLKLQARYFKYGPTNQ